MPVIAGRPGQPFGTYANHQESAQVTMSLGDSAKSESPGRATRFFNSKMVSFGTSGIGNPRENKAIPHAGRCNKRAFLNAQVRRVRFVVQKSGCELSAVSYWLSARMRAL